MKVYVDPVLVILYLLALGAMIVYTCGRPWAKEYFKNKPRTVDISFKVDTVKHNQAVADIIGYLDKNGCQFYMKKFLMRDIKVSATEVSNIISRNFIQSFRIVSKSETQLFIIADEELKFKCFCKPKVFWSLMKVTGRVNQ